MADLSAVLRKTIDGLPQATPQLRAKVYEKARAAIARQIETANPPLSEEVVEARRAALDEAIENTEAHYAAQEAGAERRDVLPQEERAPPVAAAAGGLKPLRPASSSAEGREQRETRPPEAGEAAPASSYMYGADQASPADDDDGVEDGPQQASDASDRDREDNGFYPAASTASDRDTDDDAADIPPPDLDAPAYPARRSAGRRRRAGVAAGLAAVLVVAAVGTLGWMNRDRLSALGLGGSDAPVETAAGANTEAGGIPGVLDSGTNADGAAPEASGTDVAALENAAAGEAAGAQPNSGQRRFTQRLLADGTEVDMGPAAQSGGEFDEGTEVAAATLTPAEPEGEIDLDQAANSEIPTLSAEEMPESTAMDAADNAAAEAPDGGETVAALSPDEIEGIPPVAQDAVFYEERSAEEPGTQQTANVVWSVVNEPPAEGEPPEPAIRAVAEVPEENISMTMTIRRNADVTLPASHVIELMFDVPEDFSEGGIANVQRLALKPTEQARGDPLIGVAGKISDGFFIIALNNLEQAVQTNKALMDERQWIDIPLAYSSGRRALLSIEKGIPGDRAFEKAMEAWAAKT